jgi:hypothetical protein
MQYSCDYGVTLAGKCVCPRNSGVRVLFENESQLQYEFAVQARLPSAGASQRAGDSADFCEKSGCPPEGEQPLS